MLLVTAFPGLNLPLRKPRKFDLVKENLYTETLALARHSFPHLKIGSARGASDPEASHLIKIQADSHTNIQYNGVRYGASDYRHGRGCSFAYVNGRQAAKISRLLTIHLISQDNSTPSPGATNDIQFHVAVINKWIVYEPDQIMPWANWYVI